MRKIWLSSNVACSVSFSLIALARSVPNGFSMMMRARSAKPGLTEAAARPRARPRAGRSGSGDGRRRRRGRLRARRRSWPARRAPADCADERQARRERRPTRRRAHRGARTRRARPRANARKRLVVEIVERGADDAVLGQQARLREMEQPGQQLAPGQVAGRAEQHHDVRAQRRDQARVDVDSDQSACAGPPRRCVRPGCTEPFTSGLRPSERWVNSRVLPAPTIHPVVDRRSPAVSRPTERLRTWSPASRSRAAQSRIDLPRRYGVLFGLDGS